MIGIFDNIKRSIVSPVSSGIEIPLIEKRSAQIISLAPSTMQIMDLENYEISDIDIPEDEEIKNKLDAGKEVEFWRVLGKQKVVRVKG